MKIAFVLDDTLDSTDGVQQYVTTLGRYFTDSGHDVHYLAGDTSRSDLPNVHSLAKTLKVKFNHNRMSTPLPASTVRLRTFLHEQNYDVLHVQMPYSPFFAAKIVKLAPKHTAIVGTFHIIPYSRVESTATRLLGMVLRTNLQNFDTILSVSSVAQDFCKSAFNIESAVLPNVVNTKQFKSGIPLYKNDGEILIVFLGRLVSRKGALELLKAASLLDTKTAYRIVLCGKGEEQASLERFVDKHKLHNKVTFTGFVSESEKADYLASADIAVFPSTGGESFGIVLIEAMASGASVVLGGDNSGYRSVMGERQEQLFDPHNSAAFSALLKTYIESEDARNAAYNWQQKFVEQFDVAVVGNKLLHIYKDAIAKKTKNDDN